MRPGTAGVLIVCVGIGIGLISECCFAGLVYGISSLWFEGLLLPVAAAGVALDRAFRKTRVTVGGDRGGTRWLAAAFALLVFLELTVFAWVSVRTPRGGWDAWAIWNLRAHFLYRGGGALWRDGFTNVIAWSHPDYPLLLPAFVAWCWELLGRESRAVPIALAGFFTFGSAALMAASLAALRGVRQGLLAGIALVATPFFFVQGAMQCADVPVAFFRLATLATFAMADRSDSGGLAALAGSAAALDGWTKNEGLLWFAAFLLARVVVSGGRLLPAYIAGAAPVLAPIVYFKARIAPPSYIFDGAARAGMLMRATDAGRYRLIAIEGFRHAWDFGPLLVSAIAMLAVYLAVAGLRRDNEDRSILRTGVLAVLFTALGYFAIYLLEPLDLAWILRTSSDRLLLQLWPGIIFLVFLAARVTQDETQAGCGKTGV